MQAPKPSESDLRLWRNLPASALSADQKNALIRETIEARQAERIGSRNSDPVADARLARRLQEAKLSADHDPDAFLGASGGGSYAFRPMGDKRLVKRKEIQPALRLKILATMAQLWDANPLARRMVMRLVNYVVGDGVKLVATNGEEGSEERQKVQDVLDRFWSDGRNQMDRRLPRWLAAYFTYGELCLRATQNPANGLVRLAYVSPEQVFDVKSEEDDIEQLKTIVLQPAGASSERDYLKLDAIRVQEDPTTGKDRYGRLDGEAFYWAANVLPDMVRGRPSQLVVADILDADEQAVWNGLERGALANAFVWDVTHEGRTEAEIAAWQGANGGVPKPGSVVAHNEKVKWQALSVDLKTGDSIAQHDLLVGIAAMALGMPAMWFTAQSDPNRANGENLTGPTLRDMTAVQKEVRAIVEDIGFLALDAAVRAGVLSADLETRKALRVELAELSTNDTAVGAAALGGIVAAGMAGKDANLMSDDLARRMVRMVASQLGIEVDEEKEDELLEKAKEEKAAEQEAQFGGPGAPGAMEQPMPPAAGGKPAPDGQLVPFRQRVQPPARRPGAEGSERPRVVAR